MVRSACVHPHNRQAVALALKRNGFLTQGALAVHLEVALSTVNNFCRGVNVSIAKFEEICDVLGLEAGPLTLPPTEATSEPNSDTSPTEVDHYFAYDRAWVGRASATQALTQQLQADCRLLLIVGIAGIGKTALAERLALELQTTHRLIRLNFDYSEQTTDFSSVAIQLLEKCGQPVPLEERRNPKQLVRHLLHHLQKQKYLLLIDSFEEILEGDDQGESRFRDATYTDFFEALLATDAFQSRLIITSQTLPAQIVELGSRYRTVWQRHLLKGLSEAEQLALFEKVGFDMEPRSGDRSYLVRIGKAYEGHPLALRIITGEIGSDPFFGNVMAYWNRYGSEIEAVEQALAEAAEGKVEGAEDKWTLERFTTELRRNVRKRLEQTFQRLHQDARFAYILLCEAAVYRCPVPEDWWLTHLDYWNADAQAQATAIEALRDRYLIEEVLEAEQYKLKQHTLIRSVALDHLDKLDATPESTS
ncbi:MAG: ATP-binding protein [Cyanobacteria bacterium J06626_18]